MPMNPYDAAVRLRLPNGRPDNASTASASTLHGGNDMVGAELPVSARPSATCPDARSAKRGLPASVSANPAALVPPFEGSERDGLTETSDCCASTRQALPAIARQRNTLETQ